MKWTTYFCDVCKEYFKIQKNTKSNFVSCPVCGDVHQVRQCDFGLT